jgi:hypothetical protein
MFLLGDPAVKLFGATAADVRINDQDLALQSLDGRLVTAQSDSFAIRVIVRNTGLARSDSLRLKLVRTSPASVKTYFKKFPPVFNQDTLLFKLVGQNREDAGSNQFQVTLDDDQQWPESDETNNTATLAALIPLNGTQNLYPVRYAVIPQQTVELVWQNANLTTESERDYLLQVDTTATFSSPFLINRTVRGKVLLRQNLTLIAQDSLTYYWRTRLTNPTADESSEWSVFSFTHLKTASPGWGQFSLTQKTEGTLINLEPRSNGIEFTRRELDVQVNTYGGSYPFAPASSLKIDNLEYNTTRRPCRNNTLNLVAFDKTTLVPYLALDVNFFDSRVCGREPQVINSFSPAEMVSPTGTDLIHYISNVALSDSVLLFTIGDADYTSWPIEAKSKLAEFGISPTMWDMLEKGEPLAILGRKGASPGTARVFRATTTPLAEQPLFVGATLTGKATDGKIISPRIGPAARWRQLRKAVRTADAVDKTELTVYAISTTGARTQVAAGGQALFDLSTVSATEFPFLQLEYNTRDSINLSAAQLHYWMVDYDPVPEGIIAFRKIANSITVQEGQPLSVMLGFANISTTAFTDSLQVETFQRSPLNTFFKTQKIKGPNAGDTTFFQVPMVTKGQVGTHTFGATVNPRLRPEVYYENNQIEFINRFQVLRDRIAPVLDVQVDGRWPVNRDFISPNPVFQIELRDENPFLLKEDTLGVNLFWQPPCSTANCAFQRVPVRSEWITWSRQTATDAYRVTFRPQRLADGLHGFRFELSDASGNLAGGQPYEIELQVEADESTIFQPPYPNPSTGSFTFQCQVSGVEAPQMARLQIRSLDGRLIRDFQSANLSNLAIGTNAFTWDGLDAQGNPLRSGLFLYIWTVETATQMFTTQGKLSLIR